MKSIHLVTVLLVGLLTLAGCGSMNAYHTPGPRADLNVIAPPSIQAGFDAKPSQPFPANILVVHLQGRNYTNHHFEQSYGASVNGRYSVILVREVEEETHLQRILELPGVSGLAQLNRMLLPEFMTNEEQLRMAASRLQADLILMYTFDTTFHDRDHSVPLSVITLGLSPTRKIKAITTASALLIDTRTGYVYSTYEVTEAADTLSTS